MTILHTHMPAQTWPLLCLQMTQLYDCPGASEATLKNMGNLFRRTDAVTISKMKYCITVTP